MSIEYHCRYDEFVSPDKLKRHPKNAKVHPEEQIEALCRFIRVSGWRQVVTVSNRSGFVVAGNARALAAKSLGCDAPVVYQDFESEADEIAYLLADNRLAEMATTDDELLQSNLDFLDGAGFELGVIGFDNDVDLDTGGFDDGGSEAPGDTQKDQQSSASLDEVRVFVMPEKCKDFFELMKEFASRHGESAIRWQRA